MTNHHGARADEGSAAVFEYYANAVYHQTIVVTDHGQVWWLNPVNDNVYGAYDLKTGRKAL